MNPVPVDMNCFWNPFLANVWNQAVPQLLHLLPSILLLLFVGWLYGKVRDFIHNIFRPRPLSLDQLRFHKRR